MKVCIPSGARERLLTSLQSGKLDAQKLASLESKARKAQIGEVVGDAKVSPEEADSIFNISRDAMNLRDEFVKNPTKENQIAYGKKVQEFTEYTDSNLRSTFGENALSVANFFGRTLSVVGDLGWLGRQGWGTMSHPEWWKGWVGQFGYLDQKTYKNLQGLILGDPDYQIMKKGGLKLPAVSGTLSDKNEEFMSDITRHVPVLSAIERTQQGVATQIRYALAKKLIAGSRLAGEDVSVGSNEARSIMNTVNNFSGAGNLGVNDKFAIASPVLNPVLFSARKISATMNMVPSIFSPTISGTVRLARIRNLVGSLAVTSALLEAANLAGAKVGVTPNASDLGHAVFGKNHIDFTGGNAGYAVLLSRWMTNSSTGPDGTVTKFDKGYKPKTRGTITGDFVRNKLSPMAGTLADFFWGPNPLYDTATAKALFGPPAKGSPFDLRREALKMVEPMVIDNIVQGAMADKDFLGALFDYGGFSNNFY